MSLVPTFLKNNKRNIITATGTLAVLFYMGKVGYSNVDTILGYDVQINLYFLFAAALVLVVNVFYRSLIWRAMLNSLDNSRYISINKSAEIFTYSWVSRYIPGNIGPILSKAYFGNKTTHTQESLYLSGIFETIFSIVAKLFLALLFIPAIGFAVVYTKPIFIIAYICLAVIGILIIDSKAFYTLINYVLKKIEQKPIPQKRRFSYFQQIYFLIHFSVLHILRGIGFFLFALAFLPAFSSIYFFIAVFLVSSAIGVLSVFVPAGIGVTEGVMIFLLQTQLSLTLSIFLAALYRVFTVGIDLILWGSMFAAHRKSIQLSQQNKH